MVMRIMNMMMIQNASHNIYFCGLFKPLLKYEIKIQIIMFIMQLPSKALEACTAVEALVAGCKGGWLSPVDDLGLIGIGPRWLGGCLHIWGIGSIVEV